MERNKRFIKAILWVILVFLFVIIVFGKDGDKNVNDCQNKGGKPVYDKELVCTKFCYYDYKYIGCQINGEIHGG